MFGKSSTSLGGLEPPTFRLTAERANQLRHRDSTQAHVYGLSNLWFVTKARAR